MFNFSAIPYFEASFTEDHVIRETFGFSRRSPAVESRQAEIQRAIAQ
jgi:hypothetical protein